MKSWLCCEFKVLSVVGCDLPQPRQNIGVTRVRMQVEWADLSAVDACQAVMTAVFTIYICKKKICVKGLFVVFDVLVENV